MMETAPGPCHPVRIKQEPIDNLTVIIKTEPEWESEENTGGLPDCTKNDYPEILHEETQVYPTVKREPVEITFEKCVEDREANVDPLAACDSAVKKEITEHIVKKEDLSDYPNYSIPLKVLSEEEREKNPDGDSKTNVLVNIVPFLKQELDSNLHSIHERRASSVSADSCSESVRVFDDCEDSTSNCPESPRLVIAEPEDTSDGAPADDVWEPRSLLGDGWRVTVFRCGHCMALAWDVFKLARHDCCVPQNRKSNSTILGRLRRGTQVKYVNTFGCHVCGKLFFKRKSYRKHVCTMHSEAMLLPFVKYRAYYEGVGRDWSSPENLESLFATRLKNDTRRENLLEPDPKSAHDGEVAAEDSAFSDRQSPYVGDGDNPKVCAVCSKESCQMHKYIFVRAKDEVSEETPTFSCRACDRDFRCEENYWRHMYYHGFKTENVSEEEPTAESQPDGRVGAKKKATRRPRKKSVSSQPEQSEDTSSQLPLSSLADLCSPKSGSQREGTGGVGTSVTTAEVCFAPADACEIHNPHLAADRIASKNKKRKMSKVSLTTEEDGTDPNKKRCILRTVEHSSPADNSVTVEAEVPPTCCSPRHSNGAFQPEGPAARGICGSVSTSEEREEKGETSDTAVDDVSSERLEKNERSTRGAVNEKKKEEEEGEIEIITEKLSEDRNGVSNTVRENFSAVTSTEETCSSLQLRKGMNQDVVEVIDIDDDDDDENGGGDTDNIDDKGRDDRTSSFPDSASFEKQQKCDSHTEAVSVQENMGQESDCSRYISEQEHCQLEKTNKGSQSTEVDSRSEERTVSPAEGTSAGKGSQATALKETVRALQSVGIPLVRSGVSYGARVAVLQCANGDDGSRSGHEKRAADQSEGPTGVRLLQVSNTAVYQTVPIRQITKLILVPTVRGSENSGGTVGNLKMFSKLSLDISGTPRTGPCLLKCEKCSVLGAYGPAFFSHKCAIPNSINNGSKVLTISNLRVVTNGTTGISFSSSEGASSQVRPCGGVGADKNSTGSVVWKCLRCEFATYRSDVFKSHSCESVTRVQLPSAGQMPGVGTKGNADVSPGGGTRRDVEVSPGDKTRRKADVLPGAVTARAAEVSPGAATVRDVGGSPVGGLRRDASMSPSAGTRRGVGLSPGDRTKPDAAVVPGAEKRSKTGAARSRRDASTSPSAGARRDVGVSPGDRTKLDAAVVPDAEKRSKTGAVPAPPVEYLWKCMGCSLKSNSRQCLLMHKCSSFKRKANGPDRGFTSAPTLMCCKCGFKTAGRLMFATHQCLKFELPPWWPRDRLLAKRTDHGAPDAAFVKVCEKSPQETPPDSVHDSVLNCLLMHSGAKMVENNGSFLVMLPNMSTPGSPAQVGS